MDLERQKEKMKCCFCEKELLGIGNSVFPFFRDTFPTGKEYGCCNDCNIKFVVPVRCLKKYNISDYDWYRVYCCIKDSFHYNSKSFKKPGGRAFFVLHKILNIFIANSKECKTVIKEDNSKLLLELK